LAVVGLAALASTSGAAAQVPAAEETLVALDELSALGLQVQIKPTQVSVAPRPAAGAASTASRQSPVDAFRAAVAGFGARIAANFQGQVETAVRGVCRLAATGFVLESVSISMATVTATFTPTPELCAELLESAQ
jgi:hypothetical protein